MYFDYICLPLLSSHFCWPLSSSKTGLFSLSCIFFWCACVIVCVGTPVGTSVHVHGMHAVVRWQSWVWVLRHSPPLPWDGASQWPGTSPHGPGLLTAGSGNFPVSSSILQFCVYRHVWPYVCLLGGCRRSALRSSGWWGKSFIACSVSSASYHIN